jgi:hypothetical protein
MRNFGHAAVDNLRSLINTRASSSSMRHLLLGALLTNEDVSTNISTTYVAQFA